MRCMQCDASIPEAANFCEYCGAAARGPANHEGWADDGGVDPVDDLTRAVSRMGAGSRAGGTGEIGPLHGVMAASVLGLIGCFLPVATGSDLSDLTVMAAGSQVSSWFYAIPGSLMFIAVVSFLIVREAVDPREAWIGAGLAASGMLLGMTSLTWGLLKTLFGDVPGVAVGIGVLLPWVVSAVVVVVLSRELFRSR